MYMNRKAMLPAEVVGEYICKIAIELYRLNEV